MTEYTVIYQWAGRNYSASVPDLPGCIACGDTMDETQQFIKEAIELHIELAERGRPAGPRTHDQGRPDCRGRVGDPPQSPQERRIHLRQSIDPLGRVSGHSQTVLIHSIGKTADAMMPSFSVIARTRCIKPDPQWPPLAAVHRLNVLRHGIDDPVFPHAGGLILDVLLAPIPPLAVG